MNKRLLKAVYAELSDCGLEPSVVSFEPDDGAATFDMVMSAVHTVTWKVDGYRDEVIRFIVEDDNEISTIMDALMVSLLGLLPVGLGAKWSLKHEVTAMYDEEATLVDMFMSAVTY